MATSSAFRVRSFGMLERAMSKYRGSVIPKNLKSDWTEGNEENEGSHHSHFALEVCWFSSWLSLRLSRDASTIPSRQYLFDVRLSDDAGHPASRSRNLRVVVETEAVPEG